MSANLSWEYVGEELAIFWESPFGHGKEKIASFWWPAHPPENTKEIEEAFEGWASMLCLMSNMMNNPKCICHPLIPGSHSAVCPAARAV